MLLRILADHIAIRLGRALDGCFAAALRWTRECRVVVSVANLTPLLLQERMLAKQVIPGDPPFTFPLGSGPRLALATKSSIWKEHSSQTGTRSQVIHRLFTGLCPTSFVGTFYKMKSIWLPSAPLFRVTPAFGDDSEQPKFAISICWLRVIYKLELSRDRPGSVNFFLATTP